MIDRICPDHELHTEPSEPSMSELLYNHFNRRLTKSARDAKSATYSLSFVHDVGQPVRQVSLKIQITYYAGIEEYIGIVSYYLQNRHNIFAYSHLGVYQSASLSSVVYDMAKVLKAAKVTKDVLEQKFSRLRKQRKLADIKKENIGYNFVYLRSLYEREPNKKGISSQDKLQTLKLWYAILTT